MWYKSKSCRSGIAERGCRIRPRLRVEELEPRTLLSVFSPAQIVHAYGIAQVPFNGAGQTIAIVDAYFDPTIQADLDTFNNRFGLPQLDGLNGDGTFTQLDLSHKTLSPSGDDWTLETALDVEWAHAVAPRANILLVEAASDTVTSTGEPLSLLNAVHTAATTRGVVAVSMSWGVSEASRETSWDSFFTTAGVTFLAASGDSGAGTIWPAVSPYVVSVGGTTLKLTSSNTIYSETGWGNGNSSWLLDGSGGGFSQYEPLPSYQTGISASTNGWAFTSFGVRLNPDVAYVANPNTGLYVYDGADGGWNAVGGTSAGAPQWAALVAIADQERAAGGLPALGSTQTLKDLYANPGDFHDITSGSTGTYDVYNNNGQVIGTMPVRAQTGYDLVTGLGSPAANLLIPALASGSSLAAVQRSLTQLHTASPSRLAGSTAQRQSGFLIPVSALSVATAGLSAAPANPVGTGTPAALAPALLLGGRAIAMPSAMPAAPVRSGSGTDDQGTERGDNLDQPEQPAPLPGAAPERAPQMPPTRDGQPGQAVPLNSGEASVPDSSAAAALHEAPTAPIDPPTEPAPVVVSAAVVGLVYGGALPADGTREAAASRERRRR